MPAHDLYPLSVQKALVGRLLVLEVIEPLRGPLHAHGQSQFFVDLTQVLDSVTKTAHSTPNNAETLADFLDALGSSLKQRCPIPAGASSVAGQVHADIESRIATFQSQPEDFLGDLFAMAQEVAERFYGGCGLSTGLAPVSLELGFTTAQAPHSFEVALYLGAVTTSSGPGSSVRLDLQITEFDQDSWHAALYVLCHELIVHAYADPPASGSASFAEGWMDLVAARAVQRALSGTVPFNGCTAAVHPSASSLLRCGNRYHDARYQPGGDDRSYGNRLIGRQTAERVLALLSGLPAAAGQPEANLWTLSAALNRSGLPGYSRDELTQQLHSRLDPQAASRGQGIGRLLNDCVLDLGTAQNAGQICAAAETYARAVLALPPT